MKYLLAINGGGSKTDFLVTDMDLKSVYSYTIKSGTNPWYHGVENVLKVFRDGIESIPQNILAGIVYCYAGISGCKEGSHYNTDIQLLLNTYFSEVKLDGDLEPSFRSLSDSKDGYIAVAGTGTAIAHISSGGRIYYLDGVASGGRYLGYLIGKLLLADKFSTAFFEIISKYVDLSEFAKYTYREWFTNDKVLQLSVNLNDLIDNEVIFRELRPYLDLLVNQWSYRIINFAYKYNYNHREKFDLVLSGNFWNFNYIRENVINEIRIGMNNCNILYSHDSNPALGCIKLAKENYCSLKKS
ncbi:MAG: hypothetical protein Q8880_12150 [Bacteroidota bacterium]|nr:hypothetical protein [Bacteroidota bacterium]